MLIWFRRSLQDFESDFVRKLEPVCVGKIGRQHVQENALFDRQWLRRLGCSPESFCQRGCESRGASSAHRRFQKLPSRFVMHKGSSPHPSLFKSIPGSSTSVDFIMSSHVIS